MGRMSKMYVGVSEASVQKTLNKLPLKQKVRPVFPNKPPLKPVEASEVMERNQIDLVDFHRISVQHERTEYSFVFSVIDIFSWYLHFLPSTPTMLLMSCASCTALLDLHESSRVTKVLKSKEW